MEVVMRRFGFVRIVSELVAVAAVILSVMTSCSGDGSVYKLQYPKFSFSPYTFSTGETTGYAEVTFLTPDDDDFPKVVEINGTIYNVAIINGYKDDSQLSDIQTIDVDDCILTINSHAYEKASNVTEMSIPNVMGLGTNSLPENLVSLKVNANAIDSVGTNPLSESLPNPDKLESLTITDSTIFSIDLSGMGGEESSLKEITLEDETVWPIMPHPVKEGMKFQGWFTDDPTVNPDAKYAEAGKKPESVPVTVYPYFVPGEDVPEDEPEKPIVSMPSLNVIKTYTYGIDKTAMSYTRDENNDYIVTVDINDGWKCNWTVNGTPDTSTSGPEYKIVTANIYGKYQLIGYILDESDNAVAAVLFELHG